VGQISLKCETPTTSVPTPSTNHHVILHLKCTMADVRETTLEKKRTILLTDPLTYDPDLPFLTTPDITGYQPNQFGSSFDPVVSEEEENAPLEETLTAMEEIQTTIQQKIKRLKIHYYKNCVTTDKKVDCFWCTCPFDTPPCYLPKYIVNDEYYGYGCFCSPECATAFLMKEHLDESIQFERYHLLNKLYGPIYDYKENIRPAPNPHYLLQKYYGELTIEEYRFLLKTPQIFRFLEKPITRMLPELHTENYATFQTSTGTYKVKRESEKDIGPSKTELLMKKFQCHTTQ
jgi:hypothetical protein